MKTKLPALVAAFVATLLLALACYHPIYSPNISAAYKGGSSPSSKAILSFAFSTPAAAAVLNDYISGAFSPTTAEPLTVREIIRRNAIQDMALAGSPEALEKLRKGLPSRKTLGAEWYLRIRDLVYAER